MIKILYLNNTSDKFYLLCLKQLITTFNLYKSYQYITVNNLYNREEHANQLNSR